MLEWCKSWLISRWFQQPALIILILFCNSSKIFPNTIHPISDDTQEHIIGEASLHLLFPFIGFLSSNQDFPSCKIFFLPWLSQLYLRQPLFHHTFKFMIHNDSKFSPYYTREHYRCQLSIVYPCLFPLRILEFDLVASKVFINERKCGILLSFLGLTRLTLVSCCLSPVGWRVCICLSFVYFFRKNDVRLLN